MILNSTNLIPITKFGLQKLQSMIADAEEQLSKSLHAVSEAAGPNSDWHDNAPYDEAMRNVDFWRAKLTELNTDLRRCQPINIDKATNPKQVSFGSRVSLVFGDGQEKTLVILGPYEVELSKGIISIHSALGKALEDKKEGEEFDFITNEGKKKVKINKIDIVSLDDLFS